MELILSQGKFSFTRTVAQGGATLSKLQISFILKDLVYAYNVCDIL